MNTKIGYSARRLLSKKIRLSNKDVAAARTYIANYWAQLECKTPKDTNSQIGLPNPFLVPAHKKEQGFDFDEMYYWDSYFMAQGLLDKDHKDLVIGMLDNLLYMFNKFGVIPNASRVYMLGRSQAPFLTSFIWDVNDAYKPGKKWLDNAIKVAIKEYETVWMGTAKPHWRQVDQGLSRYYDINMHHDMAEAESGWDMTPRFNRRALDYLPVDLNALLYKYETDFARFYRLNNDQKQVKKWEALAAARKAKMDDLMASGSGVYFDYDYVKKRRGSVVSLATFYPLWAGMLTQAQADKLMRKLWRFEERGGLATTDEQILSKFVPGVMPTQWAHPNGWAPLQLIAIQGMERYGYHKQAKRIALKWLKINLSSFNKDGIFYEKYNVVNPRHPASKGLYPTQTGFGWTNAVFERLCREYIDK